MRGIVENQMTMLSSLTTDQLVPKDHPKNGEDQSVKHRVPLREQWFLTAL